MATNRTDETNLELLELVNKLTKLISAKQQLHIPISIFGGKLSPAESLVKYLKEHQNMRYSQIAKTLQRDSRGIWTTHKRAQQKKGKLDTTSAHKIPASTFANRDLSILEHVVSHLLENKHRTKDIAKILNKSPSTIAAVSLRARRKQQ